MSQRRGALLEVANLSCIDTRAAPWPVRLRSAIELPKKWSVRWKSWLAWWRS